MSPSLQINQRDDGLYEVISGDIVAGPFPSWSFAMQVAGGDVRPESKPAPKFHRLNVREVRLAASA
jgi:hypothetical protein